MSLMIFMRHASTPANEAGIAIGRENVFAEKVCGALVDKNGNWLWVGREEARGFCQLSKKGEAEADAAGEVIRDLLAAKGISRDNVVIHTSDQERAIQTGVRIHSKLCAVEPNPGEVGVGFPLREIRSKLSVIDLGTLTGRTEGKEEGKFHPGLVLGPNASEEYGCEKIGEYVQRIAVAYKECFQLVQEGKVPISVMHSCGVPIMAMLVACPEIFSDKSKEGMQILGAAYKHYANEIGTGTAIACDAAKGSVGVVERNEKGEVEIRKIGKPNLGKSQSPNL